MKLLLFINNWLGWQTLRWLKTQQGNICGAVIHQPKSRSFGDEILGELNNACIPSFHGSDLKDEQTLAELAALQPDLGLSVMFGHILKQPVIDLFPKGVVNLHPSYLPYNRGAHPNVWSIVEGTPAGVTLHYIDSGVDTGDIVAQCKVRVSPTDTGERLYRKLERAGLELIQENYEALVAGQLVGLPQSEAGTHHFAKELASLDKIELDGRYTGRQLLNLIRARTFPPHRGAYFEENGKRVYVRVELEEDAA